MDTSEQYIKMCEKAEEIQQGHIWAEGDFFHLDGKTHHFCSYGWSAIEEDSKAIWLPRQDQLQEMVRDPDYTEGSFIVADLFYKLKDFYNVPADYPRDFASMEQLWLAFVMKEKFGKVWSEDEWIAL